jgi:hypothetical protein
MALASNDVRSLPLVDDTNVKNTSVDTCVGISVIAGNAHITFASITNNYSIDPPPLRRVVSSRLVVPIRGIVELRDILDNVIKTLAGQGMVTPPPTIAPPSRPN